jgi:hypothetical protein
MLLELGDDDEKVRRRGRWVEKAAAGLMEAREEKEEPRYKSPARDLTCMREATESSYHQKGDMHTFAPQIPTSQTHTKTLITTPLRERYR